jgi:hypothetical protein
MKTTLSLVMIAVLAPIVAHADGGAVRLREASGSIIVTVFTPPDPLRAGPIDASVLIQDRETGTVILDAVVDLGVQPLNSASYPSISRATHERATNKLLQASVIDLPAPGTWDLQVIVRSGTEEGAFSTMLLVAPPAPRLATIWPWLLLPVIAIALFVLHQALPTSKMRRVGT